jgi:predicted transcriptional regulator
MVREVKIRVPEKGDFDEALVNLLKYFLDTETKAKIYLYLRKKGRATSEEIAKGANLYPSSVREALSEMYKGRIIGRGKLKVEGAGKNPYVYEAIPASELAKKKIRDIEDRLNRLLNLDRYLKEGKEIKPPRIPVRIRIEKVEKEKTGREEK